MLLSAALFAGPASAQFTVDLSGVEPTPVLSPPGILGASNCENSVLRVSLTGGLPGNDYEVWDAFRGPYGWQANSRLGRFPVAPNGEGVTQADVLDPSPVSTVIIARQVSPMLSSANSPPFRLRDPVQLAAPEISPTPVWECGLATAVRGQQPGDEVTLFTAPSTPRFTVASAFSPHDFVPAGPLGEFAAGETLSARYQTCKSAQGAAREESPMSTPVVVARRAGNPPLSMPGLVPGSLLPGAARFQLEGVEHGATITLSLTRGGSSTSWTEVCPWDPCPVSTPPGFGPIEEGDLLEVSQRLCPGTDSPPSLIEVKSCGDVPPPTLATPPRAGDTSIHLSAFAPDARITVFVSSDPVDPKNGLTPIGHAAASATIHLFRPLAVGDRWLVVAQVSPACGLTHGNGYGVFQE
ncbi:MAG: hypothetical protein AB1938_22620 [Myxococcota bacterium]